MLLIPFLLIQVVYPESVISRASHYLRAFDVHTKNLSIVLWHQREVANRTLEPVGV